MAGKGHFEVYPQMRAVSARDTDGERYPDVPTGEFGWRFQAANGDISAIGGEGFTRRRDAHRAVRKFLVQLADAGIDLEEAVPSPPILDVDE